MNNEALTDNILTPDKSTGDEKIDSNLRPRELAEFVGQEHLKKNLNVFIAAAKKRAEPLDHCLFYGPPGLGKTTLAHIIAHESGVNIRSTSGPILERVGDLAAILTNLGPGDVFFIDEIHRLNRIVEEALYPVMEDFELDIIIGQGPSAKTIKLPVPRFTLIGATTRAGLLTNPLRERFGIVGHLEFYDQGDLVQIIKRSSRILSIDIDDQGAREIAQRARGTPRIANRLLRRLRDFAEVKGNGIITKRIADESLKSLDVDQHGLDTMDRKILKTIIEQFSGGPVGIESLAIAVSEETDTLTDVYEPYLIKAGFLMRTPRGRTATPKAYELLNKKAPQSGTTAPQPGDLL
ncbi:MAG: Holliday junction branch migration DNA helicase RuvB [Elusimicrobia bacterium]|nr:Holliday junction branch migration DNA helicase RuvB [Elusimicrobiota bacterium]